MFYVLVILIFALCLFLMVFANDGFINREMRIYDALLKQPWLERTVLILSDESLFA